MTGFGFAGFGRTGLGTRRLGRSFFALSGLVFSGFGATAGSELSTDCGWTAAAAGALCDAVCCRAAARRRAAALRAEPPRPDPPPPPRLSRRLGSFPGHEGHARLLDDRRQRGNRFRTDDRLAGPRPQPRRTGDRAHGDRHVRGDGQHDEQPADHRFSDPGAQRRAYPLDPRSRHSAVEERNPCCRRHLDYRSREPGIGARRTPSRRSDSERRYRGRRTSLSARRLPLGDDDLVLARRLGAVERAIGSTHECRRGALSRVAGNAEARPHRDRAGAAAVEAELLLPSAVARRAVVRPRRPSPEAAR